MAIGDKINETVGDLENYGVGIKYPLSQELLDTLSFDYDFHILKKGNAWMYVDSSNNPKDPGWRGHKKATKEGGGDWRIVESKTATIVDEG